jgi:hypothetical protein
LLKRLPADVDSRCHEEEEPVRFYRLSVLATGLVAAALLAGCSNSGTGQSDGAQSIASAQPSQTAAAQPTAAAAAAAAAPALESSSVTHAYKDSSGFSCSVKVTVWQPVPADAASPVAHPLDSTVTLDSSADYDPQTDVLVPVSVTLTNTTKGFDIQEPTIIWYVQGLTCGSKRLTEARTLEFWGWYSDGWESTTWGVGTTSASDLGLGNEYKVDLETGISAEDTNIPLIKWSDPLSPGREDTQVGFFIYRDRATPNDPNGTPWVLNHVLLGSTWNRGEAIGFFQHPPYLALSGRKVVHPQFGD